MGENVWSALGCKIEKEERPVSYIPLSHVPNEQKTPSIFLIAPNCGFNFENRNGSSGDTPDTNCHKEGSA